MIEINIKVAGKMRKVLVLTPQCRFFKCFYPHDCPVHGAGGVNSSESRWMCLTNVNHGCPEHKERIIELINNVEA